MAVYHLCLWLQLNQNCWFLTWHDTNKTCFAIARAITGFENILKNPSISAGTNLTFRRGKHIEIKNTSNYYVGVDETSCGGRKWHVLCVQALRDAP